MPDQIQISAKNLGILALQDYCPRCFWLKLKLQFKMPYQIFPGIFSSIDSYSKKITWNYYEKHKKLPPWFSEFGEFSKPIPVPGWSQFYLIDEETNIKLTGVPDDIFQIEDGSYFIPDYKTAKYTANQDHLLPMYKVQLNGYSLIAESIGISPVSGVGLIYYEPQTDMTVDKLDQVLLDKGFRMEFKAHCLEVELKPEEVVKPLLAEVRRLADIRQSPEGRRGCGDCGLVSKMVESLYKS